MQLIATIKLRNERRIYVDGNDYWVVHIDGKKNEHITRISEIIVQKFYSLCRSEQITATAAADRLELHAANMKLPCHYGWKLKFYALDVLVVLVALGKASCKKVGREFLFHLS